MSLFIRRKQVKTTVRYHCIPIRVAKIKEDRPYQVLKSMGSRWNACTQVVETKWSSHFENSLRVLYEVKIHLKYDPAFPS